MNKYLKSLIGFFLFVLLIGATGCYERSVTPPYQSDAKEVTRIREQLGVITSDKEYINEEEEEEEEDGE